jgi:hypothetical protein
VFIFSLKIEMAMRFLFFFFVVFFSYPAFCNSNLIWSIDNQQTESATFNFNWINDGSTQFDSNVHAFKLLLPPFTIFKNILVSPPTSCKIGNKNVNSNSIFYVVNGVEYKRNDSIPALIFQTPQGATVVLRIKQINSTISGLARCSGDGSFILDY